MRMGRTWGTVGREWQPRWGKAALTLALCGAKVGKAQRVEVLLIQLTAPIKLYSRCLLNISCLQ